MSPINDAPEEALKILSDFKFSELIVDKLYGNYRITKYTGGATILSPRHIVLTDHQIIWQDSLLNGSVFLHDATPQLNTGHILYHQTTISGGWTLIELDTPLLSPQPLQRTNSPDHYRGRECIIPIPKDVFLLHNPNVLPSNLVYEADGILYIRGQVLKHGTRATKDIFALEIFKNNNFTIRIDAELDLHGASGFPVLVYDHLSNRWVMLATVISATYSKNRQLGKIFIHASRMDEGRLDLIERADAISD